jgi:hypothetical protein
VALTVAVALSGSGTAAAVDLPGSGQCIGDCNHDGRVTIDEIVVGVRVALGNAAADACDVGGPGFAIDGLVTSVLNSLLGCTSLRDRSDFERFTYSLNPAFGYCPAVGAVHDAEIDRRGDTYLLRRSIIDIGTAGVDDCLRETVIGPPCLIAQPDPCRILTDDEINRIRNVFAALTLWTAADSFCLFGVEDPCLVVAAQWDDLQVSDALCSASRLDSDQSERITALVQSLGAGAETTCNDAP